ncbi:hypothetical protein Ciccas_011034, partial [Cichlidogyrus casuarinus]
LLEEFGPELNRNRFLIGILTSLVLFPFALITDLSKLAIPSVLANVATIVALLLIYVYCFSVGEMRPWQELSRSGSLKDFLIGFSIAMFAFEGISLVLPIRNKMRYPDLFKSNSGVLYTGMSIVTLNCLLLGWIGFLHFGNDTLPSIVYNIPLRPVWAAFVKPVLIFSIGVSYVIQFFVPAAIFGRLMEKLSMHAEASEAQRKRNLVAMRIAAVLLIYVVAMIVPHLDLLLSLVGALCSSMLAIIIPPTLKLIHLWPMRRLVRHFKMRYLLPNALIIFVGVCAFFGGTIATIIQLAQVLATN